MKMTLAEILVKIAETKDLDQQAWKTLFQSKMNNHPEKKLLNEAYEAACCGKRHMTFGRNCVPPQSLQGEGFVLRNNGCGFDYCWG